MDCSTPGPPVHHKLPEPNKIKPVTVSTEVVVHIHSGIFSSVQSLSRVWLFATPWIAACQASLSITNSWSLPKLMSIESVMPSSQTVETCYLSILYIVCYLSILYIVVCICHRRQWHSTPVLLLGKSHGRRSLVGCSPWGRWGSDTTERLHFHFSLSCIGEGNGNPLQCSCLENPRDGEAWWAPVYGVAQSRTRPKWLSSNTLES